MANTETIRANACLKCDTNFSTSANLRRHVKKLHPDSIEELAPMKYKNPKNFLYSCTICNKNFNYKNDFLRHQKTHKASTSESSSPKTSTITTTKRQSRKCPMCNCSASKMQLRQHFEETHNIKISCIEKQFCSQHEFQEWKKSIELQTNSKFIIHRTKNFKSKKVTMYQCHRSGNYVSEGKGLRHLKKQGSSKINAYCPAAIKVTEICGTKEVCVLYTETHVGHQPDIGHLTLTKEERKHLASQIALKIPFDEILAGMRGSISKEELKRIHLATKKDLYNIEQSFNLTSAAVRRVNDALSVDAFVNKIHCHADCILFFKPQGVVMEDTPDLVDEDFALMLMNTAQAEILSKYGADCVCIDGTHGLNNYNNFELNTLLVLDELGEGFPCAFLISNRSDTNVLKLFFAKIKEQVGIITPQFFMSDLGNSSYNTWISVMGFPQRRYENLPIL